MILIKRIFKYLNKTPQIVKEKQITDYSPPFATSQIEVMLKKPYPSFEWKVAFDYYNETSGERRVAMSCRPCYQKVAIYIINANKNPK